MYFSTGNPCLMDAASVSTANIIEIFTSGFQNQHNCGELKLSLQDLNIRINQVYPEGGFEYQDQSSIS